MSDKANITTSKETMPESRQDIPPVSPVVDIYENDEEFLLHADMPGVDKEDLTIHIDNGTLEIVGTREMKKTGASEWKEFGSVEYSRSFSVPQTINVDRIGAKLRNGVLELHLPKSEAAKPRVIEIKKVA